MRTCIAISILVHAAILLWLLLLPGGRPFDPAEAQPILVDLLPAQEAPPLAKPEPPKPEPPKTDPTKPQEAKSAPQQPTPKGGSSKDDSKTAQDEAEQRAATAARLAWEANLSGGTVISLAAPPSESKSNLASEEIAALKAQVAKCWVAPDGAPRAAGFDIVIRIALKPDGSLGAAPELIRAPASLAGPPLVASAKQALQQCQPFTGLLAEKYQDWKILDLAFTADGPVGLSAPPRGSVAAH